MNPLRHSKEIEILVLTRSPRGILVGLIATLAGSSTFADAHDNRYSAQLSVRSTLPFGKVPMDPEIDLSELMAQAGAAGVWPTAAPTRHSLR